MLVFSGIGVCHGTLLVRPDSKGPITENCPIPLGDFTSRLSMMYDIAQSLGRQITFKVYMDSVQGTIVRSRLSSAGLKIVDCPHDNMKEVVDKAIISKHRGHSCRGLSR